MSDKFGYRKLIDEMVKACCDGHGQFRPQRARDHRDADGGMESHQWSVG